MLLQLTIENYAIIEKVDIHFSKKLNIITGETGAGKSIVLGALGLILGQRADSSMMLNNNAKCSIEGLFSVAQNKNVEQFLTENNFDVEENLLIRREINTNGKSRAFINDTPASLQQIKELAEMLVDLHQQFDTHELTNQNFQREVIDALANNNSLLTNYQQTFKQWQQTSLLLNNLIEQKNSFQKEADYNNFLYNELLEISLKENELEQLEEELQILDSIELIKGSLQNVYHQIKENETPISSTIKQLINQLQQAANKHNAIPTLIERLQSTNIELTDIANEANSICDGLQHDAERIFWINERLNIGNKLLKKHSVQTTNELLNIQQQLEEKLNNSLQIDDAIEAATTQAQQQFEAINIQAKTISNNRKKEIPLLEKNVNVLLKKVGMPNAEIKIDCKNCTPNLLGTDEILFLFDANKSNKFEVISKVASGGELSRLMLCIKSLVAQKINLPTLIFDEIDSGISGEAAKQVSIIMQQLATNIQIICITHQPQIAAKANYHFYVYKQAVDGSIKTNIKQLTNEESVLSIAKMLGGENPSNAAIESVREMMKEK